MLKIKLLLTFSRISIVVLAHLGIFSQIESHNIASPNFVSFMDMFVK